MNTNDEPRQNCSSSCLRNRLLYGIVVFLLLSALPCAHAKETGSSSRQIHRYAFIAGSNYGGPDRVKLKYASSDAVAFDRVMQEMGGVRRNDRLLLIDPSVDEFTDGLKKLSAMLAADAEADERREVVIYFSGHSDSEGLLLGAHKFDYRELRRSITGMPAEVHIAIIDSCSSGSLTRSKGGYRRPAFLLDASSDMKGYAFLTSSSAEEVAQESDSIKASFFTHYFLSGLRGAADVSGDRLVTLNEAYQYAFRETLASTERTVYGAQHAAYDINLTGSGEVVLTDLREISAGITISGNLRGRLFLRDVSGNLIVEMNKQHDQPVDLGLSPGTYVVLLDTGSGMYRTEVEVQNGELVLITPSVLKPVEGISSRPRGDTEVVTEQSGSYVSDAYLNRPVHVGIVDIAHLRIMEASSESGQKISYFGSLNLLWGQTYHIRGFEIGCIGNVVMDDAMYFQAAGVTNIVHRDARGFQAAGLFNHAGMNLAALQTTAGVNVVGGNGGGVQIAGLLSHVRRDMDGVQISGLMNVTGGQLTGIQVGGVFNCAAGTGGMQIGILNVGGTVNGAQIGVLNIAQDVSISQIGVVNISREMRGVPIGLVSIAQNGRSVFEVWFDGNLFQHVGFRLGTEHVYTLYTATYRPYKDPDRWALGVGLGGCLPLGSCFLNTDIALHDNHRGFEEWYDTGRVQFTLDWRVFGGYQSARRVGLYIGTSMQLFFPGWYTLEGFSDVLDEDHDTNRLHVRPTIFAGLQF